MIAAAAGGYAVKRMLDKQRAQTMATNSRLSTGTAPYGSAPTIRPR